MSVVGNVRQGLGSAIRNSSLRIVLLSYTDGLRLPPDVELCDARRFEQQCELWQFFLEGGIVQRHIPRRVGPHGVLRRDIVVIVPASGTDLSREGSRFLLG